MKWAVSVEHIASIERSVLSLFLTSKAEADLSKSGLVIVLYAFWRSFEVRLWKLRNYKKSSPKRLQAVLKNKDRHIKYLL